MKTHNFVFSVRRYRAVRQNPVGCKGRVFLSLFSACVCVCVFTCVCVCVCLLVVRIRHTGWYVGILFLHVLIKGALVKQGGAEKVLSPKSILPRRGFQSCDKKVSCRHQCGWCPTLFSSEAAKGEKICGFTFLDY